MNTHSSFKDEPPVKMAGPKERAGLTEVPVIGIPTKWTAARAKPMVKPAKPTFSDLVTNKMTPTKMKVRTTSVMKDPAVPTVAVEFEPSAPVVSFSFEFATA